jgi:hypothetical protein
VDWLQILLTTLGALIGGYLGVRWRARAVEAKRCGDSSMSVPRSSQGRTRDEEARRSGLYRKG